MSLAIGFATEFYTLWDVIVEPQHTTDAYGKHWHTGNKHIFNYIKNISTDLDKATSLHPGVPVDDGLRGKSRSWSDSRPSDNDECSHILWFGKYIGQDIAKVAKVDFPYILWALENANSPKLRALIAKLPQVIAHQVKIEQEMNAIPAIKESGDIELTILSNPREWSDGEIVGMAMQASLGGGHKVSIIINDKDVMLMPGNYKYPEYYLPIIGGKARRVKGKTLKMNIDLLNTHRGVNRFEKWVHQVVRLNSVTL